MKHLLTAFIAALAWHAPEIPTGPEAQKWDSWVHHFRALGFHPDDPVDYLASHPDLASEAEHDLGGGYRNDVFALSCRFRDELESRA